MIRVSRRRNPNIGIIVAPCAVQGVGAADEIAQSIRRLNADGRCDVLLVGRGGGSIEDLWAFNEEKVARAIAASEIPVISCVGHETDFTIADFVADVRAATPSMAAELAVPMIDQLRENLRASARRIAVALTHANMRRRNALERICAMRFMREPQKALIERRRNDLANLFSRCAKAGVDVMKKRRYETEKLSARLVALNPNAVLNRGYAYVTSAEGVITKATRLHAGQNVVIRFADGSVKAKITETNISENENDEKEIEL